MQNDVFKAEISKVLINEDELKSIVSRLAKEIEAKYKNKGKKLLLLGILKGSVVFMSDLMKQLNIPLTIDFMQASSYGAGTVSCGNVDIRLDLSFDNLSGYDVLVVEDILDTGNTLSFLLKYLEKKGADSVKLCVLLNKPDRRVTEINIDFEGVRIPDEFVVGYGLDYNERYRNLPYIGILNPEVYES